MTIDYKALAQPFAPSDIEWRVGQAGKNKNGIWAKILAYVTARAIEDRLDSVVGPQNWRNEFQFVTGGVLCGISINTENGWITKWDGSDPSDIEAFKGSISGAMKRAAVQWGIGRYLYDLGERWAEVLDGKREGAHYANCKVKVDGKEEWVNFWWLPPRGALEQKQEQPEPARPLPAKPQKSAPKPTAKQLADDAGLKAATDIPGPTPYQRAIKAIGEAVRNHDKSKLASIGKHAQKCKADGTLTEQEDAALFNELTLAERKIDAVLNQEQAA